MKRGNIYTTMLSQKPRNNFKQVSIFLIKLKKIINRRLTSEKPRNVCVTEWLLS
jgi:hypothetical protein